MSFSLNDFEIMAPVGSRESLAAAIQGGADSIYFGIANLKDRNFLQLSSGEQRLVLLARAFVKDPELLILDEPLHGLDLYNRRLVKDVIETFCRRKDKTMIMVTHYQEELPACITNSLFLKRN